MEVGCVDVVIDVSIGIRYAWVLRTEPPLSVYNELVSAVFVSLLMKSSWELLSLSIKLQW